MKTRKPSIILLPTLLLTVAALMFAGCGKPGSAGSPDSANAAAKTADGKEYTPTAKAMMASLGKTVRDTRLVYYHNVPAGCEYTIVEYENGAIKSKWTYCFFPPEYDFAYKAAAKSMLENNMLKEADKDDAALWYRTQDKHPPELTWQQWHDGFKKTNAFIFIE
ncbi:MAG: hypothetical protein LBI02_04430 [Opitutaceae bacterium]|jgi:hypothetical protein|nr:hypothetical protein [Opitutaceae bacterium]